MKKDCSRATLALKSATSYALMGVRSNAVIRLVKSKIAS